MKRFLFCLSLAVIIYILTFLINVPDYDLWARLAVGSIFFQTGHVLKHDIFSYLPTKNLWIDHEWGSSVVFYFLTKYLGEWGLFALKAVILLTIFILIIKIIKLQTGKNAGIFYLTFIGFSLLPGFANLIRCQVFTYMFFTLWLYVLEKIRRGENHGYEPQIKREKSFAASSWVSYPTLCPDKVGAQLSIPAVLRYRNWSFTNKLIWIFPATMLLWANMHGGFLAGIGLVIIYAFGELFNRKNFLRYFGILALIIPVTFINPYGFDLWNYIIEAAIMPRPHIWEWTSISLKGPVHIFAGFKIHILTGFMFIVLLAIIVSIKLLLQKERPDWTKIILFIILLYLGIKHQRHTVFFMLAASGLFYYQFVDLFNPLQRFIRDILTEKVYKVWNITKYSFGYIVLGGIFVYTIPHLSDNIIVDPFVYPVGSLEFIKQNNISGNLATSFGWGSYAFWKLYPQCKVLIDGRYEEVYSNDVYAKAMQFSEHEKNWQEVLKEYHSDILVLPKCVYSRSDALSLTDWEIVYLDEVSALLLPKNKIKHFYIYPNYRNPLYWKENLSKEIPLD
ncbi:MAG: hypothetical protein APR62_12810 [Smithella sp. SDB]|nr:MAG: hypothetical protein APR62_12810 [Smithella sp. SDB]